MDGWMDVGTMTVTETWTQTYHHDGHSVLAVKPAEAKWVDIVDKIDDVLTPPQKCPNCNRDWHPGPLTERVQKMLREHRFDPEYNPTTDDTPIVCVGAEYHGPNRPGNHWGTSSMVSGTTWTAHLGGKEPMWLTSLLNSTQEWLQQIASVSESVTFKLWSGDWGLLDEWTTKKPEPCAMPDELPTVEFGPQNWIPPQQPVNPSKATSDLVWSYWHDLTRQDIPVPERPGMDFSAYATDEISYPTNGKKAWK